MNEAAGTGDDEAHRIERWSDRFTEAFGRWVLAFRDSMTARGLPPDRWAFYIRDEPPPGEWRQEVIDFARQVKRVAPEVRNFITLQVDVGDDAQMIEIARYVDIIQIIGTGRAETMKRIRESAEVWEYRVSTRGQSPLTHRRDYCWKFLERGALGAGFWAWEGNSAGAHWPMDTWREDPHRFSAVYCHHDGTYIPSLRAEAFREGIEDWKYMLMLDDALVAARRRGVDPAVVEAAARYRAECLQKLDDAASIEPFRRAAQRHLLALHAALGGVDPAVVAEIDR